MPFCRAAVASFASSSGLRSIISVMRGPRRQARMADRSGRANKAHDRRRLEVVPSGARRAGAARIGTAPLLLAHMVDELPGFYQNGNSSAISAYLHPEGSAPY